MNTISTIFGNATAANCLLYLHNYGDGHARGIARTFDTSVSQVQKQLRKFENAGALESKMVGNSRLYEWNHHMPLTGPLREFLQRILESLPEDVIGQRFPEQRRR